MRRTESRSVTTLLAAAALALGPAACGDDDPAVDAPADEADAGEATADGATVTAADFAFEPAELTVAAGTTVTFVNEDAVRHTFTSGEGEADGTFDLEAGQGDTAEVTVDEPGTYAFFCRVHPAMTGTLTVE